MLHTRRKLLHPLPSYMCSADYDSRKTNSSEMTCPEPSNIILGRVLKFDQSWDRAGTEIIFSGHIVIAQGAIDEIPSMDGPKISRTKQHKPIPVRWRPPTSTFPLFIFRMMCFCLTFHWDLNFMWEIFREPQGWEDFHVQYLSQINQLSTVQGLVLTTVAVFISTPPPVKQIDYTAYGPYTLLSESLVFSLFGLLFQLYISVIGQSYQKRKTFKALKKNRWLFLCHIIILSIPVYVFGISLLLLLFGEFLSSSRPYYA
ncbi:hypothetical protein DEU56DRAFT_123781 [Suillus clintonianus]|uniref:uncharacterized protein n=1 Tax=Suillus clintonianus TaxID=1904413 RepID=UPI001B871438|nr:uncharacterized protein DEU56DRAFT_123781 [Suillus clintonianus]KAG2119363.1 hypothetical protein DEU56DRAFT_123781 [Suillus clintonianus]